MLCKKLKIYITSVQRCQCECTLVLSMQQKKYNKRAKAKHKKKDRLTRVGFEPTRCYPYAPEAYALDRSAILPRVKHAHFCVSFWKKILPAQPYISSITVGCALMAKMV